MIGTTNTGLPFSTGMIDSLAAHELDAQSTKQGSLRPRLPYPFEPSAVAAPARSIDEARVSADDVAPDAAESGVDRRDVTQAEPLFQAAQSHVARAGIAPVDRSDAVDRRPLRPDAPRDWPAVSNESRSASHTPGNATVQPLDRHSPREPLSAFQGSLPDSQNPDSSPALPRQREAGLSSVTGESFMKRGASRASSPGDVRADPAATGSRPSEPSPAKIETGGQRSASAPPEQTRLRDGDRSAAAVSARLPTAQVGSRLHASGAGTLRAAPHFDDAARAGRSDPQAALLAGSGRSPAAALPLFGRAPEPVIEIHIGRVDVRAQTVRDKVAAARPQADTAARAEPLAAYLGNRSRGARS